MLLRSLQIPPGFIEPCLPSPADRPPSGPDWVHEMMIAWTPGLIVLAILLHEIKTTAWKLKRRALTTLGGDRVARRPYRFRRNLEETSQAHIPSRRSKRLQAQTRPQSSLGAIHAGLGVRRESLRG